MPRANRCILPGHAYHLTHRCHDRAFLFRFGVDRTEYCRRLRAAVKQHRVSLLDFTVTANHTHLLAVCTRPRDISRMMQQVEGEFAAHYNRRKGRSGAFWSDQFHCTMIQDGIHLLNCLRYIDLNMVRAGVVSHPREWEWCGYQELAGLRQRWCLLDIDCLLKLVDARDFATFVQEHNARINAAIIQRALGREPQWTESLAVGTEDYVRRVAGSLPRRKRLRFESMEYGTWCVREDGEMYGKVNIQPTESLFVREARGRSEACRVKSAHKNPF